MESTTINRNSVLSTLVNQSPMDGNACECMSCGACNSRCTWFDGEGGPLPRQIVRMAALGLDEILAGSSMIWDCLICNRCTQTCPLGISMEKVVRNARGLAIAEEKIPGDIGHGIQNRLELGDVNGLTREEFVETVEFVSEEFSDDMDDPEAVIPYDLKGARLLYLPNPRELGVNLMHLTAMARLFHAAGETWTLSSRHTDVTNWGYFVGRDEIARQIALMVVEPAEELGIETLVLSECGHAYHVYKHILEGIIGRKPAFEVVSMPEFLIRYAEKGVLTFDPKVHPYPIAYHDPCNIGRKSGGYDPPRQLLAMVCEKVVELTPNREDGICCGGGGGLLQDSTSTKKRMISGKPKADQMKQTGLPHLATACLSCHRQLGELSNHYRLGIKVDSVSALASEALAL